MKHEYFSFLLAILMSMAATMVYAHDFEVDGIYYNITSSEELTVEVTYQGDSYFSSDTNRYTGSVTIPTTIIYDGINYSVTSIGEYAFYECRSLTSINIPNSIVSIGNRAFEYCRGLTSVDIPNSVITIGDDAFDQSWLSSVNIGSSVKSIGSGAFSFLNLTSVVIPKSVEFIGRYAFYNNRYLASIIVEEGNSTYDSRNSCNAIIETGTNTLIVGCMNTIIPISVTGIGFQAFVWCDKLESITIPDAVTNIGESAFLGCSKLKSITIPKGVTTIGVSAFGGCNNVTSITVEEGNPYYDTRDNCNAIIETATNTLIAGFMNTVIPSSVVSIGEEAFYDLTSLTSIFIPEGVTSIGNSAFMFCGSLKIVSIPLTVKSIGTYAFWSGSDGSLTDVFCYVEDIDNLLTSPSAFIEDSFSSATLHVPASALEIYQSTEPWSNFSNIVALPPKNIEIDGLYYNLSIKDATVIFNDSYFDLTGRLTIPDKVEYDGKTYNVTAIDGGAFLYCTGLTGLTIGNNVQTIGSEAFMGCNGITTLIIPQSVTNIAPGTFTDCSGLSNIMVRSGNTVYDSRGNCNAVIETATNALVLGCKKTIVPDDVMAIAPSAFAGCAGLTSVNIPEGVTSVGQSAFSGCSGLTEVYCYAPSVPETETYVFNGVPTGSATLYVPFVALDAYKATAPWNKFGAIEVIPGDNTAVSSVQGANGKVLDCYDMNGQKQSQLHKGLNIVRMSDGTVKKVMIK